MAAKLNPVCNGDGVCLMDRLRCLYLLISTLLSVSQVNATVATEVLNWQMPTLPGGLERIKDQFLDISTQRDIEYVGAVLKTPEGLYQFTYGRGLPGQDRVSFSVRRPLNLELVGFWHTHGASGAARAFFSPTDAELVRQTGLPFYLITPAGEIRVLKPDHVAAPRRVYLRIEGARSRLPRGSHPGEPVLPAPEPGSAT